MPRTYHAYDEKHKWPKGFGSLCPPDMPTTVPSELLRDAIRVEGLSADKLWAASGEWLFCAHPSPHLGPDAWHGFPVIGGEADERVLHALEREGRNTARQRRRLRRQRELPNGWSP